MVISSGLTDAVTPNGVTVTGGEGCSSGVQLRAQRGVTEGLVTRDLGSLRAQRTT